MSIQTEMIGNRLKAIRAQKNLTLDEVAKLTDVSKPMLGQIERGQSAPTITTLSKISTGLKVPLSSFLREEAPEYVVANVEFDTLLQEENGMMRASSMFPYDPLRNVEIFYLELDPGCNHGSDKHMEGTEEYILIVHGKLDMTIGGKKLTLHKQQAVRFHADLPHAYNNPYGESCAMYNIIFYPAH
ncbi:MAG TPA: XRE family transcriptional regulator [Candidatus Limiplasma sp.]|nr:XRE family transcriptional regulator [Candidatus Limiplasma sp.]HRX07818.1 XRE family transcriptional regulator [Candidatus Limiplasma sp.]